MRQPGQLAVTGQHTKANQKPRRFDRWPGQARVFVEFKRTRYAEKAMKALAGKRYNTHYVVISYYDEEKYRERDWS